MCAGGVQGGQPEEHLQGRGAHAVDVAARACLRRVNRRTSWVLGEQRHEWWHPPFELSQREQQQQAPAPQSGSGPAGAVDAAGGAASARQRLSSQPGWTPVARHRYKIGRQPELIIIRHARHPFMTLPVLLLPRVAVARASARAGAASNRSSSASSPSNSAGAQADAGCARTRCRSPPI